MPFSVCTRHPPAPLPGATGGTLSEQQLGSETGKVISGVEATQGTVQATARPIVLAPARSGPQRRSWKPSTRTVPSAFQNGMSWNQPCDSKPSGAGAQCLNLATRVIPARARGCLLAQDLHSFRTDLPAGMTGTGTATDPCRPSQCSTTPSGTPADPGCIVRRYVDSDGNVRTYLEIASRRVPDTPVAAPNARANTRPSPKPIFSKPLRQPCARCRPELKEIPCVIRAFPRALPPPFLPALRTVLRTGAVNDAANLAKAQEIASSTRQILETGSRDPDEHPADLAGDHRRSLSVAQGSLAQMALGGDFRWPAHPPLVP